MIKSFESFAYIVKIRVTFNLSGGYRPKSATLITCRFLLVHPQLNYRYSFHSEAKICYIKYDLKIKFVHSFSKRRRCNWKAQIHGERKRGKGETGRQTKILGKDETYEFKLTQL